MNAREEIGLDFLSELHELDGGLKVKKLKKTFQNDLDQIRFNFVQTAKKQIDQIAAGNGPTNSFGRPKGAWYEKQADGRFQITFKSGTTVIELVPGKSYYYVANAEAACKFIAAAAVAAEKGQLDKFIDVKKANKSESVADAFISKIKAKTEA